METFDRSFEKAFLEARCPHCQALFALLRTTGAVECPECGHEVLADEPSDPAEPPAFEASPGAANARCETDLIEELKRRATLHRVDENQGDQLTVSPRVALG
jgi:DNA-directed RNA polymerase subunit RPC12/RpoP